MTNNIDKLKNIFKSCSTFIKPPPVLKASEWCETHLKVIDGPMAGQPLKLFSFQKEMIDAIHEGKKKIVFKTSAQLGKTQTLNGILFYQMKHSGNNCGVLQSNIRELGQYLAGKIKPAIEQTPVLAELVTDKNDKSAVNNQAQIQLRSGQFIYMMSLTSPSHLRGKTLQNILLDEVDAAQESVEGDPILLAEQRATTFGEESIIVVSSTPTTKHGAINKQFEQSDQRYFYVPCPHCNHSQVMKWDQVLKHLKWKVVQGKRIPDVESGKYCCEKCDQQWTEGERIRAVAKGKFIAHNPGAPTIGFQLSRLYSPLATIKQIAQDYSDAYQSFSLATFYNTSLGETFDDLNADIDCSELEKLIDDVSVNNIPDDVVFLVAGGDQQKDRLENTLIGVSEKALYVLDHRSFYDMDCEKPDSPAYTKLIDFLKSDFRTVSGQKIPMLWANLDAGNGRASQSVYRNCNRWGKLHAIKGSSSATAPTIPLQPTKTGGQQLYVLGVNQLKYKTQEIINRNLKSDAPTKLVFSNTLPDDYFEQLTAEELKRVGNGAKWVLKKGIDRNEALDCFGYGLAAMEMVLKGIKQNPWKRLREYKAKINTEVLPEPEKSTEDDLTPQEPLKAISTKQPEPERKVLKPDRPVSRRPKQTGWISRR